MFEAIGGFLNFAITLVVGIAGFTMAREFVRSRLRFVDVIRHPAAPWIAGGAVLLLALPIAGILPIVAGGTAAVAGVAVGLGTNSGVKALKRGE